MKVSVSIPEDDVAFLDEYASQRGLDSRSAALHRAIRLLRTAELTASYEAAFTEWSDEDAAAWDGATGDGLEA
ncbi:MAG TPA: ribbon-helix-helix domain-containing protein [Candidatus Limnocylindrales bacterium]|nr:ribbon-helix-helix domain-containing protein [Candidatus Limnocylindrales bacterium]